ncbi:unnamed protein product [Lepeophtheirus salmonis]|uniref:(salmon louse) hypothetical protein n=1 Tax=Lepeophtheirus salmonis TaxID=72036 RepID=A0A7R8CHJ2_LEPSM|nr:unnamed protein product [Lepeophtheirus salmonis]CAF2824759.1 unnamed protein product [Lepeophtheirus salmonis]
MLKAMQAKFKHKQMFRTKGSRNIGCNGNGNRFDSITNCVLSCKLKEQFSFQGVGRAVKYLNYLLDPKLLIIATPTYDTCSLQSETGPCEESVVQYFHNAKTGKCETFCLWRLLWKWK